MNSAIPIPGTRARHGAARRERFLLTFLICAMFAFSGCAYSIGPILEPIFKPTFEVTFGSSIYLGEVSRAYYEENGRWPQDYDELVAFCEEEDMMTFSDIEDGKGCPEFDIDICMFKDVRFTPRPDGKLKIDYSIERRPPRAGDAQGETAVHWATGSVTVGPPDDDALPNGVNTEP